MVLYRRHGSCVLCSLHLTIYKWTTLLRGHLVHRWESQNSVITFPFHCLIANPHCQCTPSPSPCLFFKTAYQKQ